MESEKKSVVILLCGNEGVGKTSISAVMTKVLLQDKESKVLVIDVDPDTRLAKILDIKIDKTIADISKEAIVSNLEYEIVDAIIEKDNLSFLALGGLKDTSYFSEGNSLIRDMISSITEDYDYVIIDGSDGIEQVNNIVTEKITHLVLVSDSSDKGINDIKTINAYARDFIEYEEVGLILNRVKTKEEAKKIKSSNEIPLLTYIFDNDKIKDFDIAGRGIFEVPEVDLVHCTRMALSKLNV